jgi:LAO/AO transport system kinase
LIDALGVRALAAGHRVAVLAIDPTSRVSGGSVLGDRTRMTELSRSPAAFVRSSPSGAAGGGISPRSHEVLCVLEAAGYDLIFVETVGVGQAELAAVDLVDVLLLVLLAGAGDDIQGIKRGILEHADVVAFNKCEGDNGAATEAARAQLAAVLSLLRAGAPSVFGVSALQQLGIPELFAGIIARMSELEVSGELSARRAQRRKAWFVRRLEEAVLARFSESDEARQRLAQLTNQVERGELLPNAAVRQLLDD